MKVMNNQVYSWKFDYSWRAITVCVSCSRISQQKKPVTRSCVSFVDRFIAAFCCSLWASCRWTRSQSSCASNHHKLVDKAVCLVVGRHGRCISDAFVGVNTIDGFWGSATATSPHLIPPKLRGSWFSEDGSNSPRQKNPAKQRVVVAHRASLSRWLALSQWALNLSSSAGVMGNRIRSSGVLLLAWTCLIPAQTRWSRGGQWRTQKYDGSFQKRKWNLTH